VLRLVKAFLKSGLMTADGQTLGTITGTPQGGILSPLLANIALSVLDEKFAQDWDAMGTVARRHTRRRKGLGTWRLIRYADDFVVMVSGTRANAEQLRAQVAATLAPMGLRLSDAKTRVVHLDEGLDFLGFRIQRKRKRGSSKAIRLHLPVQESRDGDQGEGAGIDEQISVSDTVRASEPGEPEAQGLGRLLPARSVEADVQRDRRVRVATRDPLATQTTPAALVGATPSVLPPRVGADRERGLAV
jgi:hypothetical protein